MPSENWAALEFHRARDLSRQPIELYFPLLISGDHSVFDLTKLEQHSTINYHHQVICCISTALRKEILISSSILKIHDLLEVTLHGASVRQYFFSDTYRCITPLSLTQGSRTIMELSPEKPYQPRGPYQSRRSKREFASLPEVFAMNSNTLGTEPAKKKALCLDGLHAVPHSKDQG
jgi:hypothetical protein